LKADMRTRSRVGIVVFASMVLFAGMILVIGGKSGFFFARASYYTLVPNSQGVVEGNQVRIQGVTVGAVTEIVVPKRPGEDLRIELDIERRYRHLVKGDSRVKIKTIGLLGDKYLEVSPGSPDAPDLPPGSQIVAFRGAELDKLLAGSSDLVDNVVAITKSLKIVLGRTERGEGFLGELTSESEAGKELSKSLRQTLDSANQLLASARQGKGLVGRLVQDEAWADKVTGELGSASGSLARILGAVEKGTTTGQGLVPALLTDEKTRERFIQMVASLQVASAGLEAFSTDLAKGKGALPKLVNDAQFANEFLGDLKRISKHLATVAEKLDSTDGTAGKLIADPKIYDALNDLVVGIHESKILSWLIRNRQKSGIKKRYQEERAKDPTLPAEPPETPAPEPTPALEPTPAPTR